MENINDLIETTKPTTQNKTTHLEEIWKTTSIFLKIEDNLNIFENGRRPQFF
jgi:hypothetical protein